MSLLTVVQDVCAFVGVERPLSVFAGLNSNRTQQEMLALANEAARAIAYDEREWTDLYTEGTFTGDGTTDQFTLPADYKRLLLDSDVYRSSYPQMPMTFLSNISDVMQRKLSGYWYTATPGYYWHAVGKIAFHPVLAPAETAHFIYLKKNFVLLGSGVGESDNFVADDDVFLLDERLLKLCMIWKWKQSKGSPYAEDMSNYEIALKRVAGADKPAPIIVNRGPPSSYAKVAMPWPSTWGPQ